MKNESKHMPSDRKLDRRSLLSMAGTAAMAAILPMATVAEAQSAAVPAMQTGNGEWTYEVAEDWGRLPAGKAFGGTHGAIATD